MSCVAIATFRSVAQALGGEELIVTGEHGDQLFGSVKALSVSWEELASPWPDMLARDLRRRLASTYRAEETMRYLAPQIERAAVPVRTLWDALWWLNFSVKWQGVTLRIPAQTPSRGRARRSNVLGQLSRTEHFFRDEDMQRWAMTNRDATVRKACWTSYKRPLERFIYGSDGDEVYLRTKKKEPSLAHVLGRRGRCHAIAVTAAGETFAEPADTGLRRRIVKESGTAGGAEIGMDFEPSRENELWGDIGSGGE